MVKYHAHSCKSVITLLLFCYFLLSFFIIIFLTFLFLIPLFFFMWWRHYVFGLWRWADLILELTQTGSRLQQGQMCCSVSLIASLIFVIQKCYLYAHVQELKAHFCHQSLCPSVCVLVWDSRFLLAWYLKNGQLNVCGIDMKLSL